MSETFNTVLEQVQTLDRVEQLKLISSIAQILSTEEVAIPNEVIEENRRRLANFDAGVTTGIPYKEAMLDIRQQINNQV